MMKFDKKIPIFQWILYIQCFETDKFPSSSQDQYVKFEDRGDEFKNIVEKI